MALRKYKIAPGQKHYIRAEKGRGMTLYTEGQIVEMREDQALPIRDKLIPADHSPAEAIVSAEAAQVKPAFETKHVGAGRYSVINTATGKAMNESPMEKAKAEELCAELLEDDADED